MEFKRARNKEQFAQRESEIINAATYIYEQFGFEEVTFSKISDKTKFTRPTIYSYFKTKDEIMLKLTVNYLEKFVLFFEEQMKSANTKDNIFVANALCESFKKVPEFIHLYTVLFSIIEKNVSLEALVQFKKDIMLLQETLAKTLKLVYTNSSEEDMYNFLLFCLCFASGLCPMTEESDIQKEAIKLSDTGYKTPDFEKVFVHTLLIYLEKLSI